MDTAHGLIMMKLKRIDMTPEQTLKILNSGLVNLAAIAEAINVDKSFLWRKIKEKQGLRLLNKDIEQIGKIFENKFGL